MGNGARSQFLVHLDEFKSLLPTAQGWTTICIVILLPEAVKLYPGGIWSLLLELLKYFLFCRTISRFNPEDSCTTSAGEAFSSLLYLRLPVILINNLDTHSGGVCETPQTAEETDLSLPCQSFHHYFIKNMLAPHPLAWFFKRKWVQMHRWGDLTILRGPTNHSRVPLLQISSEQGDSAFLRELRNCFQGSANAGKDFLDRSVRAGYIFFSLCVLHLILWNQPYDLRVLTP